MTEHRQAGLLPAKQPRLFPSRELTLPMTAYVRKKLHGFELRQKARDDKRELLRLRKILRDGRI